MVTGCLGVESTGSGTIGFPAAQTYTTLPSEGAWHTSIRLRLLGIPGRETRLQDEPPLVERKRPSRQPANTSLVEFASPLTGGCMDKFQVTCARRCVQTVPPFVDSNSPPVVAAKRWLLFNGSTTRS